MSIFQNHRSAVQGSPKQAQPSSAQPSSAQQAPTIAPSQMPAAAQAAMEKAAAQAKSAGVSGGTTTIEVKASHTPNNKQSDGDQNQRMKNPSQSGSSLSY